MKIRNENFSVIFSRSLENVVRVGMLLCATLIVSYCIWTLDRGFEITDEAYYLLLAMHADSVEYYISAQQWITAGIWRIAGSITLFRLSGMALLIASASLLAHGIFSVCLRFDLVEDRIDTKWGLVAGSVIGALLYASTINFSPCYNLLASTGSYAAAGMTLLATGRSNTTKKYALFILAGCAIGGEVLSKASAGVTTLALLVIWIVLFARSHPEKILGPLFVSFGAALFAITILLINTSLDDAVHTVEQSMQLFRMVQVETIGARLFRYCVEFLQYILQALSIFAIPILSMIGYIRTGRIVFAQVGLVFLAIVLMFGKFILGGVGRYPIQIEALVAMLVMALIVSKPLWNKSRDSLVLFMGLILLPYTVAIGTGNALFSQVIDSLAAWGGLIAVLVFAHRHDNKTPIQIIGLCFMMTITLQVITSAFRPYNLSSPLTEQDRTVAIGNIGVLKVDNGTYQFLEQMKAAAATCDIKPRAPFIGLYNIPGLALPLQVTPVSTPWLNNRAQAEFVIDRVRFEKLHSVVVALQMGKDGAYPQFPTQLLFPMGFRYCGMAVYPYMKQHIQIWQFQA